MAPSRKDQFMKDDIRLARYARALSHPARIAIMRHLASTERSCFNDISKELPLADSTVSQHLSELKDAGLISGTYEPPKVHYRIDYDNWKAAKKALKEFTKMKVVRKE